jgi:MinD-like ATPase involved in chromosome partitioning or flagellar assembly
MTAPLRPVLVLAAGAAWESTAVGLLERSPGLVLLRRCVDVDDLLAAASSGQADAAVVALDVPGLDAHAVDLLHRHGVRVVGVLPADAARVDAARTGAGRVGIGRLVSEDDLAELAEAISAPDAMPVPAGGATTHVRAGGAGGVGGAGEPPERRRGRILTVWGPAGAPGRSTIAAAVAAEQARGGRPVLLVDADPYGGSIAQQLGVLDEVSGLLAASRSGLSGSARTLGPGLAVLTGLPRPDRWQEVRIGVLTDLLGQAAAEGDVVVDTGFSLEEPADPGVRAGRNQLTLEALAAADEVLVVGGADPVGLTRLARGLVDLRDRLPATPVRVVVNRMRASLGWSERDVAAMIAGLIRPAGLHFTPDDRPGVDRALVSGRTLLEAAPDGPLAKAVAALVRLSWSGSPTPPAPAARPRTAGRARRR